MSDEQSNTVEEWRPVVGYEGAYSVSNLGNVRREKPGPHTRRGRMSRPHLHRRGYPCVCLWNEGNGRHHSVHRLVIAAFVGPCPSGYVVNHIDGDKTNPVITNLEYVTPQGNSTHAARTGLLPTGAAHWVHRHPEKMVKGERNGNAKLNSLQVRVIRRLLPHMTQNDIAAAFGINSRTVSAINRGHSWKHTTHA
jgi:hypothetical protein